MLRPSITSQQISALGPEANSQFRPIFGSLKRRMAIADMRLDETTRRHVDLEECLLRITVGDDSHVDFDMALL